MDLMTYAMARNYVDRLGGKEHFPINRSKHYAAASNGVDVDVTYRTMYQVLDDCFTLQLVYGNFYNDERTSGLSPYTINVTLEKVEFNSPTVRLYPFTWDGGSSNTKTVALGALAFSDYMSTEFKKEDVFAIRTHVVVGAGQKYPTGLIALASNGEGMMTGDQTEVAEWTGVMDKNTLSPMAILATPSNSSFKSVALIGDSISIGAGMSNVAIDGRPLIGEVGFMQIGAMRAGLGYVSLGMNGQRSDGFINNARRNRMMLAQRCDKAVVEYGTNDLENGTTLENIKSYLSNIWEALHVRGVKQIYQTTIVPRTTSTDNWATTTNQTPTKAATSGGPDSTRTLLNEWIRSKPSPYLAGIIDIAPATEYGVNTGLWLPNKTPDGIHPNTQTHQAMADILADAVR